MNIHFVSLGCDKNLVDSEHMLGLIVKNGHSLIDDEKMADIIVINTCCFIGDAKEESIQTIIDLGALKEEGQLKGLIVTGCLAQRYHDEIKEELPEVDAIIGTNSYDDIIGAINSICEGNSFESVKPLVGHPTLDKRIVTGGGYTSYLKIAEGCNKKCTYCIIPTIRGDYRSIPMEEILEEAKRLAAEGVKEILLVAQEITVYGLDLYKKKAISELINKLSEIDGIEWIRLLYCYPEEINDELIFTIRDNKKVCHYIDMPIQHCNDEILKKMGRRTSKDKIIATVNKLRSEIPDMCIRTTLICGFPGESEDQHQEVLDFVREMKFDHLGAFAYSPEEGTIAAEMPNQIDEETKRLWADEVMELQMSISEDINDALIGMETKAIIEGKVAYENAYVARTYRDVPDVDGYVFIDSNEELMSGDFVDVRITGAYEYDLIGELL